MLLIKSSRIMHYSETRTLYVRSIIYESFIIEQDENINFAILASQNFCFPYLLFNMLGVIFSAT